MSDLMKDAKRLREERFRAAKQLHELVATAQKEERALSGEEQVKFNKIEADCADLEKRFTAIETSVRLNETDTQERRQEERDRNDFEVNRRGTGIPTDVQERGMAAWFLYGKDGYTREHEEAAKACGIDVRSKFFTLGLPTYATGFAPNSVSEFRAMQKEHPELIRFMQPQIQINPGTSGDTRVVTRATTAQTVTTTGGGHTIQNQAMASLQEAILAAGVMRQYATVINTPTGANWPVPAVNATDKGAILDINTTSVTQNIAFTQQVLDAKKYTSNMVNIPMELMQDSTVNLPMFLGKVLGSRIGRITEEHFATGAASLGEPEGIVTTGSSGGGLVGTTISSEANIEVGDLVSLIHDVEPGLRNAKQSMFMFHDSVLAHLRGKTDTTGRPLWVPSVSASLPDMIFGYPYAVNQEFAAFTGTSAQTASEKLIAFGAMKDYWIRDVAAITVMRLDERFAELAQTAFLAFSRHDGEYINPHVGTTNASIRLAVGVAT